MVNLSLPELLQQEIHPDPVDLCLLKFWLCCLFSHCPRKSQHLVHDRQKIFSEVLFSETKMGLSICSWTRSSSAQKTLLWGFRFCCPLSERPASDIQRTLRECNLGSPRNSDRDQPTISQDLSGDQPRISQELRDRAT